MRRSTVVGALIALVALVASSALVGVSVARADGSGVVFTYNTGTLSKHRKTATVTGTLTCPLGDEAMRSYPLQATLSQSVGRQVATAQSGDYFLDYDSVPGICSGEPIPWTMQFGVGHWYPGMASFSVSMPVWTNDTPYGWGPRAYFTTGTIRLVSQK